MYTTSTFAGIVEICSGAMQLALILLVQSTVLIAMGLAGPVGWFGRNGAATRSAIYRTTLVAVLLCPAHIAAHAVRPVSKGWRYR